MFKLLRLEDRIVLDGAALDTLHQKEQYDRHEYDLMMQASQVSDHQATPDVADADHDGDTGADHHDVDTSEPLFLADITDSGDQDTGLHVLVISSDIKDGDDLAAAAKDDVLVIRYDAANTSTEELAKLIHDSLGGQKADSIAFAVHSNGDYVNLHLTQTAVTTPDTLNDAGQTAFWKSVGGDLSDNGRIDLLACNVAADQTGIKFITDLETIIGKNVAASSDLTGNAAHGGNWTLETDHVDVQKVYFDDHRIEQFDSVMAGVGHSNNLIPNQSAVVGKSITTYELFPADTFIDPEGDAIAYSAGSPWSPTGTTAYKYQLLKVGGNVKFNPGSRQIYGMASSLLLLTGETSHDYPVTIFAASTDTATPDSLTFNFRIGASTQNAPVYNDPAPNIFYVDEGASTGTIVTPPALITATDADQASNTLTYSIVWSSNNAVGAGYGVNNSPFTISNTGQISVSTGKIVDYAAASQYSLILEAKDNTGLQDTARVVVNVNKTVPTASAWLTLDKTSFLENAGTATLTANLAATVNAPVTVNLGFEGSATYSTDFTAPVSINIPAGQSSGSITLTGINDAVSDEGETVIAKIVSGANTAGNYTPVTATITEKVPPKVSLVSLNPSTFAENGGTTVLTAQLSASSDTPVTVNLGFQSGTGYATLGTDFTANATMLTFPAGNTSQSIVLTGKYDQLYPEGNEKVVVSMPSVTGAEVDTAKGMVTATLMDFDVSTLPVVTLDATKFIYEGGTAGEVYAKVSNPVPNEIKVYVTYPTQSGYADFGTDYNVTPQANYIVIPANQAQGSITINGLTDTNNAEGAETITISIDSALTTSGRVGTSGASADMILYDVVKPTVSLVGGGTLMEQGATALPMNVVLTNKNELSTVNVYLNMSGDATKNTDYKVWQDSGLSIPAVTYGVSPNPNLYQVDFAPGETLKTLYVQAVTDGVVEGITNEKAIFSINSVNNALTSADMVTMEIVDADTGNMPVLSMSFRTGSTILEENGTGTLRLQLDKPMSGTVWATIGISGKAGFGADYTIAGAASVSSNTFVASIPQNSQIVDLQLKGITDGYFDPNETFTLTINNVVNAWSGSGPITGTVIDDPNDTPNISLSFSPVTLREGTGVSTLTMSLGGGGSIEANDSVAVYLMPDTTTSLTMATPCGVSYTDYSVGAPAQSAAGYWVMNYTGGATTYNFTVNAATDGLVEGDELIRLYGNYDGKTSGAVATAIIYDATVPSGLNVSIEGGGTFNEVNGSTTVTVLLSEMRGTPTTVNLGYAGAAIGTTLPADYSSNYKGIMSSTLLTVPAGETSATITLTAFTDGADKFYEGDETLTISIQPPSVANAYTVSPIKGMTTATILDEWSAPTVYLSPISNTSGELAEDGGQLQVRANLEYKSSNATINLGYATAGSAFAIYGKDYTGPQSVKISNASFGDFVLDGISDKYLELPNETFTISIASLSGGVATGGSPSSMVVTVVDNDINGNPQVYLDQAGFSPTAVGEGSATSITLKLDRTVPNATTVTLSFGGTAKYYDAASNPDYIATIGATAQTIGATGTIGYVIPAGDSEKNITLFARNDALYEPAAETISLMITNVTGGLSAGKYAEGDTTSQYIATIKADTGNVPKVSITAPTATLMEDGGTTGLQFNLDQAAGYDITVSFKYTADANTQPVYNDDFRINGLPGVDGFSMPGTFSAIIPAGYTKYALAVEGIGDTWYEGNEIISFSLTDATGGSGKPAAVVSPNAAAVTIMDTADIPSVSIGYLHGTGTVGEPGSGLTTVGGIIGIANPLKVTTTVTLQFVAPGGAGVANYANDFTAAELGWGTAGLGLPSPTITIPAGQVTAGFRIGAAADSVAEGNETLKVNVYDSGQGYTPNTNSSFVTYTILDSDFTAPVVGFSYSSGSLMNENQLKGPSQYLTLTIGNTAPFNSNVQAKINLALNTETAVGWARYADHTDTSVFGQKADYTVMVQEGENGTQRVESITDGYINLTFSDPSQTIAYIQLTALTDGVYEAGNETFTVKIDSSSLNVNTAPAFAAPAANCFGMATMTVVDKEVTPPKLSFNITNPLLSETNPADGTYPQMSPVSLKLSTATVETITVHVSLGQAASDPAYDSDYYLINTSGTAIIKAQTNDMVFTIPPGKTEATLFTISTKDDSIYEGADKITMYIDHTDGGAKVDFTTSQYATATIVESDTNNRPVISLSLDTNAGLGSQGQQFVFTESTDPAFFANTAGDSIMRLRLDITGLDGKSFTNETPTTVVLSFNDKNGAHPEWTYTGGEYATPDSAGSAIKDFVLYTDGGAGAVTDATFMFDSGATTNPSDDWYKMSLVIQPGNSFAYVDLSSVNDGSFESPEKIVMNIMTATGADINTSAQLSWTATLLDDDYSSAPAVSLSFLQASFGETGSAVLKAHMSQAAMIDTYVKVNFTSPGYQAIYHTDAAKYTAGDFTITDNTYGSYAYIQIPKGASFGTISLKGHTDGFIEYSEPIIASAGSVEFGKIGGVSITNGANVGASDMATLWDADGPPVINIGTFAPMIAEGTAGGVSVGIPLTINYSAAMTTTITLAFGSGASPLASSSDFLWGYTNSPLTAGGGPYSVTIAPGATSTTLNVSAFNDTYYEVNETLTITVTGYAVGSQYTSTSATSPVTSVTIDDNDRPYISMSYALPLSFGEAGGQTSFTLNLYDSNGNLYTGGLIANETVTLQFSNDGTQSKMNGKASFADYQFSTNGGSTFQNVTTTDGKYTLVMGAGVSNQTIFLKGADDNFFEGTETFNIRIDAATPLTTNEAWVTGASLSASIMDNDTATYVKLVPGPTTGRLTETSGGWVEAWLVGADGSTGATASSNVTVNVSFAGDGVNKASVGGTAADVNYNMAEIEIPAGFSKGNLISLTPVNDSIYEGPETFSAYISNVTYALTAASGTVQTYTIADDDPGPTVSLAIGPKTTMAEAGGSVTMTLYLSSNGNYAYNTAPATEFAYLDFGGTANFGSIGSTMGVTSGYDYYVYGTDGNTVGLVNGKWEVSIPRGQSKVEYYIKALDDNSAGDVVPSWGHYYEGTETIHVTLGTYSTGAYLSNLQTNTAANTASASIVDDDLAPRTLSLTTLGGISTFAETYTDGNAFNLYFNTSFFPTTVTLSFAGAATLATDGAVTDTFPAGEDYQVRISSTTPAYFTAGAVTTGDGKYVFVIPSSGAETSLSLYMSAYDDNLYEGNETLTIKLDSVIGGVADATSGVVTGTIMDNDMPIISVDVSHGQNAGIDFSAAGLIINYYESNGGGIYDWRPNQTFTAAEDIPVFIVPTNTKWNGHYYMTFSTVTTGANEPNWSMGSNVTADGVGGWTDAGLIGAQWSDVGVSSGSIIRPLTNNSLGNYYVAQDDGAPNTSRIEPNWAAVAPNVGDTLNDGTDVWTNIGTQARMFTYERDGKDGIGKPFTIVKNVATTDGVRVDWELDVNRLNAAGFTVDYAVSSVTKGTITLSKEAGIPVVIDTLGITILGDDKAEFNTSGTKVEDIAVKISNARWDNNNNPVAFTDAYLAAEGVVSGNGASASATAHLYVVDDDFYPGESAGQIKMDGYPLFKPLYTVPDLNSLGSYNLGALGTGLITEGGLASIGSNLLSFNDSDQIMDAISASMSPYNTSGPLTYTIVTAPSVGKLFVDANGNGVTDTGEVLSALSTFGQNVITSGLLKYTHGGGETTTDTFTFTVSDGTNISYQPTGGGVVGTAGDVGKVPWTFNITAASYNDKPVASNQIFWVQENLTGGNIAYIDPALQTLGYIAKDADDSNDGLPEYNDFALNTSANLYATAQSMGETASGIVSGSYIVYDPENWYKDTAGNAQPIFQLETTFVSGVSATGGGTKLVVKVANTAGLDYEVRSAYTLHVKVNDTRDTIGQSDAWVFVNVNDVVEPDQYGPIKPIANATAKSGEAFVYQFASDTFPKDPAGAITVYRFAASSTTVNDWLNFDTQNRTFWSLSNDPDRPTSSTNYTITVFADYYYQNGLKKGTATQTFTLQYSTASLELDAVMDALQYLDTDGADMLPADGDQIPVQEMMAARGNAADANAEVSEVLALLDAEAYLFDAQQA